MRNKYPIVIHWIGEPGDDGYYFAYLPDWGWSTVSATACTRREVLCGIDESLETMIAYYTREGKPIPQPGKAPFEDGK